jgi:hypothetical protein
MLSSTRRSMHYESSSKKPESDNVSVPPEPFCLHELDCNGASFEQDGVASHRGGFRDDGMSYV